MTLPWHDPGSDPVADVNRWIQAYSDAHFLEEAARMEGLIGEAMARQHPNYIMRLSVIRRPGCPDTVASTWDTEYFARKAEL